MLEAAVAAAAEVLVLVEAAACRAGRAAVGTLGSLVVVASLKSMGLAATSVSEVVVVVVVLLLLPRRNPPSPFLDLVNSFPPGLVPPSWTSVVVSSGSTLENCTVPVF